MLSLSDRELQEAILHLANVVGGDGRHELASIIVRRRNTARISKIGEVYGIEIKETT